MIKPNYIEKLLDEVEVEWKALGEVTLPTSNIKWRETKDTYRYIDLTSVSRETNKIIKTTEISAEDAPSRAKKLVIKNDVIFATTRPTQQRVCLITEEFSGGVASTGYCILRAKTNEVLPKWIYHYIFSSDFKRYLEENQSGSAYPAISDAKVKEFKIPIPSLKVQEEIIRILDSFSDHTAELTAELTVELTALKKQYEYYREKLFTFEEGEVEWKSLGEVANFRRGSFPQPYGKGEWYDGDGAMPFVQVVDVGEDMRLVQNTKNKISKLAQPKSVFVKEGTVIVTLQGSIGRVAITQYDCYVDRTLAIFESFLVNINKKYFAYQLQAKFAIEKDKARGSTIKTITKEEFTKFLIPIPPLTEQERIVSILDKLDALTISITEGLPREIELREKQYEYYRNMLLSFPKEEVED
ncbi:restriction endonuclease subunit S [Bacillus sp. FSL W8-0645]|uniref:restriction endonuclease subunit S n=1 Tax=Bacillus sp. FSL W8-0645 TaxID=2954627 RepID=UPI0030F77AA8